MSVEKMGGRSGCYSSWFYVLWLMVTLPGIQTQKSADSFPPPSHNHGPLLQTKGSSFSVDPSDYRRGVHPGRTEDLLPAHPSEHPPHIATLDVQCQKQLMNVQLVFDKPFDGVVYSKGYYADAECHYVSSNSHQTAFEFTIYLDRCGTVFIDDFATGGHGYLDNTLVIQTHPGFQEVWDTARHLRCVWTGQFDQTVTSAVSVNMLEVVSFSYSGDTVDSYMDIQLGRGPFAGPVKGLVKIGETLTMVVYVVGATDFDVHVKECIAHDGTDRSAAIRLTDSQGCVVKKKLMGPWQVTRQTGNTGASVIAFALFQAFKFPDKIEVYLECNIQICKHRCPDTCPAEVPGFGRKRRRATSDYGGVPVEPFRLQRGIMVVAPEDIAVVQESSPAPSIRSPDPRPSDDICMTWPTFVGAMGATLTFLLVSCFVSILICVRARHVASRLAFDKHPPS